MNIWIDPGLIIQKKNSKKERHKSLVGSVIINAEFGSENHSSIPTTAIERGLKPLDTIIDLQIGLSWWW
jgi:hypothetical protein